MDGARFDGLVRRVVHVGHSRRRAIRLALAVGMAVLAGGAAEQAAAACRQNGRGCDPNRHGQCCSSKCKRKRDGTGVCKRVPSAFGCTIKQDSCNADEEVACPDNDQGVCFVLASGRPFCAEFVRCFACETDLDCTREAGGNPGKCITGCGACAGADTRRRACVFAEPPPR